MAEPVTIPIRADVSQLEEARAALERLNADRRRTEEMPGGGPGPSAAAGAAAGGGGAAGVVSVRGLIRELQVTEGLLRSVNQQLAQFAKNLTAGAPPAPLAVPPGGGPGAPTPGTGTPGAPGAPGGGGQGGGGGGGGAPPWQQAYNQITGLLGALGIGVGAGAAFLTIREWTQKTRSFEEEALVAAMGGGLDREGYQRLVAEGRTANTFTGPDQSIRMSQGLLRYGLPYGTERSGELGDLGLRAFGNAPAAGQFARDAGTTLRGDYGEQILREQLHEAKHSGKNIGEMTALLNSMLQLEKQSTGQGARTPGDVERMLDAKALLEAMPGGIGMGAGGERIAEGIMGADKSGLGGMMQLDAWSRAHGGRLPSSDADIVDLMKQQESPGRAIPAALEGLARLPGSKASRALFARQMGIPTMAGAEQAAEMTPDRLQEVLEKSRRDRVGDMDAEMANSWWQQTLGGKSLMTNADAERQARDHPGLGWFTTEAQRLGAEHPWLSLGGKAIGGTALSGAAGWGFMRTIRGMLGGAGRAGAGGVGGLSRLGPLAAAAGDIYEAHEGEGLKRFLPIAGGAIGAGVGAVAGGGVGAAPGFMWGSAAGGLLEALLGGGSSKRPATGIAGPAMAPGEGGWLREEVAEHLVLMRIIAGRVSGPGSSENRPLLAPEDSDPYSDPRRDFLLRHPDMRSDPQFFEGGIGNQKRSLGAAAGRGTLDPNDPLFDKVAAGAGIEAAFLRAIVKKESSFDPMAESGTGPAGLGQITRANWRKLRPGHSLNERFDPEKNLEVTAELLRQELDAFGGDKAKASIGYHHGRRHGANPNPTAEEVGYVQDVARDYRVRVDLSPDARGLLTVHHEDPMDGKVIARR